MKQKHFYSFLLCLLSVVFFLPACSDDTEEEPAIDLPVYGSNGVVTSKSVRSEAHPQKGQKHRSSNNFSTSDFLKFIPYNPNPSDPNYCPFPFGMYVGPSKLKWSCPPNISFTVQIDKSGTDGTFAKNLTNGSVTDFTSSDKLYIADPIGAPSDFTITYSAFEPEEGVVYVNSDKGPMSGQSHRSSENFQLGDAARYKVECSESNVSFTIAHDVSAANDKTIYTNVKNGSIINTPTDNKLYISDPSGASTNFLVKFVPYDPAWMSGLSDGLKLSQLSIPGTHDTGTGTDGVGPGLAKCQNYTIPSQLNFGIRYFDLRLKNDDLGIFHGSDDCEIDFYDVMKYFKDFLTKHPKETILMQVKAEDDSVPTNINKFFNNYPDFKNIVYFDSKIPTLGQARGKVVLFRRFTPIDKDESWGINVHDQWPDDDRTQFNNGYDDIYIEDRYYDVSKLIHDSNEKSTWVKEAMESANNHGNTFHIIFTSIAGRPTHTPWDYAWGGGPVLEINPEMSEALYDHLKDAASQNYTQVGTILMDFYNKHGYDDPYHNVERIINFNYPKDKPYLDITTIRTN